MRDLMDASPDALVGHRDGVIVYVNAKAAALSGYSPSELVGLRLLDLVGPKHRTNVSERIALLHPSRPAPVEIEESLLHRNGREVPIEVAEVPIVLDGKPTMLGHLRDITRRKELESWLRVEDRLASIGTLAAGVVHEVNNALSGALGHVELLSETLDDGPIDAEVLRESLSTIRDGILRAVGVARDVTLFARRGEGSTGPTDIHRVLESCATLAKGRLPGRVRIIRRFEGNPMVRGSSERLGQIFLNLILNAIDAIVETESASGEIRVFAHDGPDGRVVVEVSDDGIGMSREVSERSFDPLFTTKPQGTGLGLSIVRSLVEEVGGVIGVESVLGAGTVFRVSLETAGGA